MAIYVAEASSQKIPKVRYRKVKLEAPSFSSFRVKNLSISLTPRYLIIALMIKPLFDN